MIIPPKTKYASVASLLSIILIVELLRPILFPMSSIFLFTDRVGRCLRQDDGRELTKLETPV
jgi:hypothetical protein